jgi:uncharacterized membrane protein YGL010W
MNTELDTELEKIEREGNDDFRLLDAVGAHEFSTEHLIEMHYEARHRLEQFDRLHRAITLVGATSAGWILAFVGAYVAHWKWAAVGAAAGLVLSIFVFVAGLFWLALRFKNRGELDANVHAIETELTRRKYHRSR